MREIKLGYECYVFTNWGLCKARVHKIIYSIEGVQYKVRIDIDSTNLGKTCNFYYTEDQLYSTIQEAKDAVESEGLHLHYGITGYGKEQKSSLII